jgi:hypothetical protein
MTNIEKHLSFLGHIAIDAVTGQKGVVTSVCFDLYGCIQAVLHPGIGADGEMGEQLWFDISRLRFEQREPVMPPPNYATGAVAEGRKGPAEKPAAFKA